MLETWIIFYRDKSGELMRWACEADDDAHAREQFADAEPDAAIVVIGRRVTSDANV